MSRPTNVTPKSIALLLAGFLPALSCLSPHGSSEPVDDKGGNAPRPRILWKVHTGG